MAVDPDRPRSIVLPESPVTRRDFLERGGGLVLALGALGKLGLNARGVAAHAAARATLAADEITLANDAISAVWTTTGGSFRPARFTDGENKTALPVPAQAFTLAFADKTTLDASDMRLVGPPVTETLSPSASASRAVERLGGRRITLRLRDAAGRLEAIWRGVLRDGGAYVRQELTLRAIGDAVPLRSVAMFAAHAPNAMTPGTVRGTPVVIGNAYVAMEHPLADNVVDGDLVRCRATRTLPLRPGTTLELSAVVGVTRPGQLRRDFLTYVERERAHPYRTFLHYNSWYDIGYFNRYSEADALGAITALGTELHDKRGVTLESFLFDDGWDDPTTLWHFNSGFPDGFTKVAAATHRFGAAPGVWLSPWGGYGQPREERLAYGKQQGFETNADGFALSGPVYYKRFRDTCVDMIRRYGVNQFKIDGTGDASSTFPGSPFDSDFDAAIHLIGELRAEEPNLYVNLTTGTYPSPFWLRYADSIWRGGDDHDFAGIGTSRQRWITYRDADTYEHVVRAGALFPMNSLMLHGMIYAKQAHNLMTDPGNDFPSEARSYFGTGTQLQEMYITPALLSSGDWDVIAECAKWSRTNAGTLMDTHWVGGDPQRLEPYGWASWSPAKGILTLRNPSNVAQDIAVDVARAFELPDGAPQTFIASSPWRGDQGTARLKLRAGNEHAFHLAPFEVVTVECSPT
ncbi:MAG TPA: enterotoxin [Gemmatimonadaceae bacterium]|nr:enterotoxin [Gemmatimonadaceae bacterium]